ncbi:hypothetical protein [Mesorhizobium sp. M0870]|uniref:hypothetical protein n=1 Tax=Mesorhizobium sp. M0870 TaxID=2957016 RepID=UPI00333A9F73
MNSKIGRHPRLPWQADDPQLILSHCRWGELKGTYKKSAKEAARGTEIYERAKKHFDESAAADLIDQCVRQTVVEQIVDLVLATKKPVRIVIPHPEYDPHDMDEGGNSLRPTNALPFAYAAYLAQEMDCPIDDQIIETARPGRTKLKRFPRFLWQPAFTGEVRQDCAYVLADDNCTLGGTLATLRTYILSKGGTIAAVTALSTNDGLNCRFPIAGNTVDVLKSTYSVDISSLWIEEIGHDIRCLTESEGTFLADWPKRNPSSDGASPFQRLRSRLAAAAAKGE